MQSVQTLFPQAFYASNTAWHSSNALSVTCVLTGGQAKAVHEGTAAWPAYSFFNASNSGLFYDAVQDPAIGVSCQGNLVANMKQTGEVQVPRRLTLLNTNDTNFESASMLMNYDTSAAAVSLCIRSANSNPRMPAGSTALGIPVIFEQVLGSTTGSLTNGSKERMRIHSDGNVGIGTSVPLSTLHVKGPALFEGRASVNDQTDGGVDRGLAMWDKSDNTWGVYTATTRSFSGAVAASGNDFSGLALRFRANDSEANGFIFENSREQCIMSMNARTGNVWCYGDVTVLSDARMKEDITPIPDALSRLCRLSGYTYRMIDPDHLRKTPGVQDALDVPDPDVVLEEAATRAGRRRAGLLAQEVLQVLPEAVHVQKGRDDTDGLMSIAYDTLVPLIVEAIKELAANVNNINLQIADIFDDRRCVDNLDRDDGKA
jgi:hypothetical protein